MVAAVSSSLDLPSFWLERPHTWFNMCESTFATCNIISPLTKYHHCVGKLPVETVASIEDVVNNFMAFMDLYEELKKSELGRRERFRVFSSPTRKHFDDAKREDASPLKTTRLRKTRRATDAKFCVTGVSDIS